MAPSAALLRTLAAVAPGARIVDPACGEGRHVVPLVRLGFDVHGAALDPTAARAALADVVGEEEAARRIAAASPDELPEPGASADWMVVTEVADLGAALREAARVLAPGGWVWVEAASAETIAGAARAAGLLDAQEPAPEGDRVHAIYRAPGGVG